MMRNVDPPPVLKAKPVEHGQAHVTDEPIASTAARHCAMNGVMTVEAELAPRDPHEHSCDQASERAGALRRECRKRNHGRDGADGPHVIPPWCTIEKTA